MRVRMVGACLWLAVAAAAQPGGATLRKIIAQVGDNQSRLPNYICGQNIERWSYGTSCPTCEVVDRLRLDVAVIRGRELFAWPGAGGFDDRDLFDMIGKRGMVLVGDYAGLAYGVFLMDEAEFTPGLATTTAGRPTLQFSYKILGPRAGFQVRVGGRETILKYRGAFWVDAGTLDLVRLEMEVTDIPAGLRLNSARATIDYHRVRIGNTGFVLPATTESEAVIDGVRCRNRTVYSDCRQYVATSTIRFDERPDAPAASTTGEGAVPAGLMILSALAAPADLTHCAAGDEVAFVVLSDARRAGFLLPKGAVIHGRIAEFTQNLRPSRTFLLGVRTTTIEFGGRTIPFRAQLVEARRLGDRAWMSVLPKVNGAEPLLRIDGSHTELPQGVHFLWSAGSQEKP